MSGVLTWFERKSEEGDYIRYLKAYYLQHQKRRLGHWPESLVDVPSDLESTHNPGYNQRMLEIHLNSSPELHTETLTETGYSGTIQFNWTLGGHYLIKFDRPP